MEDAGRYSAMEYLANKECCLNSATFFHVTLT